MSVQREVSAGWQFSDSHWQLTHWLSSDIGFTTTNSYPSLSPSSHSIHSSSSCSASGLQLYGCVDAACAQMGWRDVCRCSRWFMISTCSSQSRWLSTVLRWLYSTTTCGSMQQIKAQHFTRVSLWHTLSGKFLTSLVQNSWEVLELLVIW